MSNGSNIQHGRHYVFKLQVHWVFVSNSRRRVFDARAIDVLHRIFAEVCADAQAALVEMDDEDDPVHLPISVVRQDMDVSVSYNFERGWSVRVQGHNLTNERARFDSDNNRQNLSNDGGYQVYGRSYLVDVGVNF
jgi:putative transposase